jgi:large subunit ribosomal protein L29
MKTTELREMSDEQLVLTLKETEHNLFRLRMQAQTERLDAPSELRRHRRLIAQIKTVQTQRTNSQAAVSQAAAATAAT